MATPDAFGFWNHNKEPGALDDLPIPRELRERAGAWVKEGGKLGQRRAQGETVDWRPWTEEGNAIASAIKHALPAWTVFIFDGTQPLCRWRGLDIAEERRLAEIERRREAAAPRPLPAFEEPFPDKWVRIMGDNCASGVWNSKGENCDEDDVPLGEGLRERLRTWAKDYDDVDGSMYEQGYTDWTLFAVEGLAIARAVKAELPDWTVFYHDEAKAGRHKPVETYDYEIKAEGSEIGE